MTYQITLTITTATKKLIKQFAEDHNTTVKASANKTYIFSSENFDHLHELASDFLNKDATDLIIQK